MQIANMISPIPPKKITISSRETKSPKLAHLQMEKEKIITF